MVLLQDILFKCEFVWTCGEKKYQEDDLIKVSSFTARKCTEFLCTVWQDILGKRELVWTCSEKKYQKDNLIKVSIVLLSGNVENLHDILARYSR